jgi:hypothetical protein
MQYSYVSSMILFNRSLSEMEKSISPFRITAWSGFIVYRLLCGRSCIFVLTRFYYQKRNLTHHIKSSHEGKKYECTYPDCDWKLCTLVSEICMNQITFHLYLEYIVTFSLKWVFTKSLIILILQVVHLTVIAQKHIVSKPGLLWVITMRLDCHRA